MVSWFLSLPDQIQSALIGAISALVIVFLRALFGLILDTRRERRERRKSALTVYGAYADPLAHAMDSLFWRLREIFHEPDRAVYLKLPETKTEYQIYKKNSTVYRMAASLGWIRAFRRELSLFTVDDRNRLQSPEDAIAGFEGALADGQGVEKRRVEGLWKLWKLEVPEDDKAKLAISVKVEREIIERFDLAELSRIREQSEDRQREICTLAAEVLCKECEHKSISQDMVRETYSEAVELLGVREAWLYRDWQAAIGDLMLCESTSGKRRFEVKGYADFCRMREEGAPEREWIELLERIFHNVDISNTNGVDARVQQLRTMLDKSARLLIALSEVKERPENVSKKTLEAAEEIVRSIPIYKIVYTRLLRAWRKNELSSEPGGGDY